MQLLIVDKTTGRTLHWCTDSYIKYGSDYYPDQEMTIEQLIGANTRFVQPRISKTPEEQLLRTRNNAEVFTPAWICNLQNNSIDEKWFGRKNIFNIPKGKSWIVNYGKISFPPERTWQEYIKDRRMEISCGEAPYLVSRYDVVAGQPIPIPDRIGLLDRKLRIITENTDNKEDWYAWAIKAYENIYGFDYQGDNVLLARENLLCAFINNYVQRWGEKPSLQKVLKIANIVAWNIWQMEGITFTVPYAKQPRKFQEVSLFENIEVYGNDNVEEEQEPVFCKIRDWKACTGGKIVVFKDEMRQ